MSSLSPKDRVSLCSFTFSDGRRCRTPRAGKHPRFCFYHAQKDARAQAAETLGKDLAFFFSGDYLSACDLSTALARLIPAVVRGDVKPKTAHTVAYLVQTLMQAIHISQHEYCEAFDTDDWREAIRNSVKGNYDYRFPPHPKPEQPESPQPQPQPAQPPTQAPQRAPSPHTSLPATSAEFVQHVVAGLQTGGGQVPQPAQATQPAPAQTQTRSPIPTQATPTPSPTPAPAPPSPPPQPAASPNPSAKATPPQLAEMPPGCQSDAVAQAFRPEESAFSSRSPLVTRHSPLATSLTSPTPKSVLPPDSRALHFDHNCRLLIDGKPV